MEQLLHEHLVAEKAPLHLNTRLMSYGERLSALLIAGILDGPGRRCRVAFPEAIGLKARGDLLNASIDLKRSGKTVKKTLSAPGITIVPGFYGILEDGSIGLLGRGGSDYSAACIASCLDATSLDIWKDARGFLSSDPSIIPDVIRQESLTYDEAAELAYFGARILHPRTVEPLIEKKIPIRLFSTSEDHASPLSVINGQSRVSETVIKSITFTDDFSVLKISGAGVGIKPGVLAKVTAILDDHGININSVITSQIAINLIVGKRYACRAGRLISALDLPVIKEVKVLEGTSLLALVGHGMVEQHGVAARAFSVLAGLGINVHLSSMGASDVTTYLVIDRQDRDRAIHAIHREFFPAKQASGLRKAG
jgi:aspartate kinase/aspartokinase/homoserine dehydrogenase 1